MPDLLEALPVPLGEQIAEVRRELTLRRRNYPHWVQSGRLKQATADRQIRVMEAVLATLEARADIAASAERVGGQSA